MTSRADGRVQERANLLARGSSALRGPLGEHVDAAVHVRVRRLVELLHRLEHLARLLRARRRVEERQRLAVELLLEDREIGAQALRVQGGSRSLRPRSHRTPAPQAVAVAPLLSAARPCRSSRARSAISSLPLDCLGGGREQVADARQPTRSDVSCRSSCFSGAAKSKRAAERVRERADAAGSGSSTSVPVSSTSRWKSVEGPLDVPLARPGPSVVEHGSTTAGVEAAAGRQLDEPEAIAALDDDVQPAVVEALEHFGHRGERADCEAVVVGVARGRTRAPPPGTRRSAPCTAPRRCGAASARSAGARSASGKRPSSDTPQAYAGGAAQRTPRGTPRSGLGERQALALAPPPRARRADARTSRYERAENPHAAVRRARGRAAPGGGRAES